MTTERIIHPEKELVEFVEKANIQKAEFDKLYKYSIENNDQFWKEEGNQAYNDYVERFNTDENSND